MVDAAVKRPRRHWRRWFFAVVLLLVVMAALGPRLVPHLATSPLPDVPQEPLALQQWIDAREVATSGLRDDNQARVVWANPESPAKTDCTLVYLHGFSASQGEGSSTHGQLARAFGCNLYLPRLPGHGLKADDALSDVTAQQFLDASAEALAIGQALGRKVVLIGTSLGGALAIQTAATHPQHVQALLL